MAKYYHNNQEQNDLDWLTDYIYISYAEYEAEKEKMIKKNRTLKGISPSNVYVLHNMCFSPIETLIEQKKNDEKNARNERKKLEATKEFIKNICNCDKEN